MARIMKWPTLPPSIVLVNSAHIDLYINVHMALWKGCNKTLNLLSYQILKTAYLFLGLTLHFVYFKDKLITMEGKINGYKWRLITTFQNDYYIYSSVVTK